MLPKSLNIKKIIKILLIILLLFIVYLFAGAVLYYSHHKKVSQEFIESFETMYYSENVNTNERVLCIDDNTQALIYRIKMIEAAKSEIILSTFDFFDDESGLDVMAALMNAADRNVKVNIIIDGVTSMLRMPGSEWFNALASHKNITVKRYNPINLIKPWRIQARLHDKYLIIDDTMYLLGGRNTYNLFLGDYKSGKNHDRELLVYSDSSDNSSLSVLKKYFNDIWNEEANVNYSYKVKSDKRDNAISKLAERYLELKKLYPEAFEETNWEDITYRAERLTLLTGEIFPYNKRPNLWYSLNRIMLDGDNITILTPYIICNDAMYKDLKTLCENSNNVEIILNAVENGANPLGCSDYLNEAENILATGAKVYEYSGSHSTHIKTILIDDNISIIGSFNFDMRSVYLDTELMVVADCKELNAMLRKNADEMLKSCRISDTAGNYTYGDEYKHKDISAKKNVMYNILRFITSPFRYLL